MDTSTLPSAHDKIGQVFTPLPWAKWALDKFEVVGKWLAGATILDPTGGEGAFIIALYELALENGSIPQESDLERLFIIEKNPEHLRTFSRLFSERFSCSFPSKNVFAADIILNPPQIRVDILVGNPPWANFNDLPTDYKDQLKPYFVQHGLTPSTQDLLLGGSRVDLAALILQIAIARLLKPNSSGVLFVPTSLFFGEGAHRGFREYSSGQVNYCFDSAWQFEGEKVFENVSTSYALVTFRTGVVQRFPLKYYVGAPGRWKELLATPLHKPTDPLFLSEAGGRGDAFDKQLSIRLAATQQPRQGINTCGANEQFIFNELPQFLPREFMYPLLGKEIFRDESPNPRRWIFLPYNRSTSRPLTEMELRKYPSAWTYLNEVKDQLVKRKGQLLGATTKRGFWWALLGVGPYSFAPYKIAWEAYGKANFHPILCSEHDGNPWQANQAMHAFIPAWSVADASRILSSLKAPEFERLLLGMNGGGKCNWAQPGKIKRLLAIGDQHRENHEAEFCFV